MAKTKAKYTNNDFITYAGGTGAHPDVHCFTLSTPYGTVHVDPTSALRHPLYRIRFSHEGKTRAKIGPDQPLKHSGLWHDIKQVHRLPSALKQAREFAESLQEDQEMTRSLKEVTG